MGRVIRWSARSRPPCVALALWLCALPITPTAMGKDNAAQVHTDRSFRLRAKLAMEAALGRALATRQDAVDAAYLSVEPQSKEARAPRAAAARTARGKMPGGTGRWASTCGR